MKHVAFIVILFIIALFAPHPSFAVCRFLPPGQTCSAGQFPQTYSLGDGGSPQCTKGSNGQYNVCCDFESEANAADSVRAPICGSSQELGKANSSCWICGGDLRCAGLDFGLEKNDTSPELFNKKAISPTDTIEDMDKVWRVDTGENFPETFRFNGIEYNRNGRGIVMCRSNVLGCGASDLPPEEKCKSALFPNENITDEVTDDPNAGNVSAPATIIDGRPGRTTFTMETSQPITLASALTSLWSTVINWVFRFPVVDGRVKTTESNLTPLMKTVLGTLDGRYDNEGTLTGAQKGGKLLPLALQRTLSWPQEKATDLTNYVKEWYVGRDCGWLGNNEDLEGRVNPEMAVTQNLTDTYPTTLGGFVIWDAILAPHKTNGQPGIPSTNMVIDPGPPIGSPDPSTGEVKLNESFFGEVYGCLSDSMRHETTRRFFDVFGFLGFGEDEGSGWNTDLPVDASSIFSCGEENKFSCIFFRKVKTFTQWINGLPAMTSALASMDKDETPEGVAPDLVEKLRNDYAGAGNTFLPQVIIDKSRVNYYNDLGHSSTILEGASSPTFGNEQPKLPHHAVKRTIDRFTEMTCMLIPLAKQNDPEFFPNDECTKVFENVSRQHGSLDVPAEISSAVAPTWRSEFQEGILGKDFLEKQYKDRLNLIITQLTEEQRALLMTKIQGLINTYVTNGAWPNSGLANTDYQRQIHDAAQTYGINEAFLYALWIEETHASSVGDYPFGCGGYTDFSSSLNCVMTDPTVQTYIREPLPDALCMYADGHRGCTFEAHPNFVRNLMYYYDTLTTP